MSPGSFKLLALDIDGTLVDRSLEIRPANLAALRQVIASGIPVVLATGRMYRSALRYAEEIDTDQPLICYQGAVVRSRTGEVLREWGVSPEGARTAVRISRETGVHVNLYQDDRFYVETLGEGAERYAAISQMEPQIVDDLMGIADGGSTKVVFVGDPVRLRSLEPEFRAAFAPGNRVTFSLPEFLEVVNARASKGTALAFICERLGITPAEVLAAGDAPNDVEMLRFAGLGACTSTGFPDALAAADVVFPPPEEDGIAELARRYLLP
ncbi:MAG: Cof-type HAD-IIB family hydrolase [Candidatus Dormibacteria bacterium]